MGAYLKKKIRFLNDTPELPPDVHVLLEGSDREGDVVLLHGRDVRPPLEEGLVLLRLYLVAGHSFLPLWPPRDCQRNVLRTRVRFSLVVDELADHLVLSCSDDLVAGDYDRGPSALSLELFL